MVNGSEGVSLISRIYPVKTEDKWRSLRNCQKLKQSRYRPGVAQRVPGGSSSQISRHSAQDGDKVVSLTYRSPLHQGNIPGTHFC